MSKTILIIEDNYVMLRIWQTELEKAGFLTITTANSRMGINRAKEDLPSLIMIDSVLPDMDGYELCRKLKEEPKTAGIPVIFMSNFDDSDDFQAAIEAGASDYLLKSKIMPEQLIERINQILSGTWKPVTKRGEELNIDA